MIKGFTILETVMVVVIIAILATMSIAGYWQLLDNARQKVCEANLETLATAAEIYALEHNALPASLGQLSPEHVHKAYAKVMERKGIIYRASRAFVRMNTPRLAYAQFLTYSNLGKYGAEADVFLCPSDGNGRPSYGMNSNFAGQPWGNIQSSAIIVGECDNYQFSDPFGLCERHIVDWGLNNAAIIATKNKKTIIGGSLDLYGNLTSPGDWYGGTNMTP
jgi:prepilin-type N-terminal cleavage/methylation domain-containing protein